MTYFLVFCIVHAIFMTTLAAVATKQPQSCHKDPTIFWGGAKNGKVLSNKGFKQLYPV